MEGNYLDAMARIDAAHEDDPESTFVGEQRIAKELLYARRMSERLETMYPDASEPLRLAVRAQHLGRWKLARAEFPAGRAGYKEWRSTLMRMHAEEAGEHLRAAGYSPEDADRVGALIRKIGLRSDAEAQALEDVACLVFLEHYFAEFAAKHDRVKLVDIAAKTWNKMSERARSAALGLNLDGPLSEILNVALEKTVRSAERAARKDSADA